MIDKETQIIVDQVSATIKQTIEFWQADNMTDSLKDHLIKNLTAYDFYDSVVHIKPHEDNEPLKMIVAFKMNADDDFVVIPVMVTDDDN